MLRREYVAWTWKTIFALTRENRFWRQYAREIGEIMNELAEKNLALRDERKKTKRRLNDLVQKVQGCSYANVMTGGLLVGYGAVMWTTDGFWTAFIPLALGLVNLAAWRWALK